LISRATTEELIRVLGYKRFRLSLDDRRELLAEYLTSCELVEQTERCSTGCRDPKDQPFLDLAESGKADLLISGDQDLLTLVGQTTFLIESAEAYRRRFDDPKQIS
jgi:putative PIN family toxin of toxin-antitoxin system